MEQQNVKTATIDGVVIARSDSTEVVEGNHYFPPSSISWENFNETELTTGCPWKGTASYYTVTAAEKTHENIAWTYHAPKEAASQIKDYVAFYPVVTVA